MAVDKWPSSPPSSTSASDNMALHQPPAYFGNTFTKTIHTKAEGATDPVNNKLPAKYVVVVTGAGKGLGYEISLAYAKAGARSVICRAIEPLIVFSNMPQRNMHFLSDAVRSRQLDKETLRAQPKSRCSSSDMRYYF